MRTRTLTLTTEELDILKRALTFVAGFQEQYYTLFPSESGYSDGDSTKQEKGEKVLQELRARITQDTPAPKAAGTGASLLEVLQQVAARWDKDDERDAPELGAAIRAAIAKAKKA
jgi:hypothetical protein